MCGKEKQAFDWIALLPILPSVIALIIAIWGDILRRWGIGPKIEVTHGNNLPYNKIAKITKKNGELSPALFIRVKVKNAGRTTAHKVYGRLTSIKYAKNNKTIQEYDPCTLNWVGYPPDTKIDLGPEDHEFLDVIYRLMNDQRFHISTKPLLKGSSLAFKVELQPHIISLSVYSEDAKTQKLKFRLRWLEVDEYDSAQLIQISGN